MATKAVKINVAYDDADQTKQGNARPEHDGEEGRRRREEREEMRRLEQEDYIKRLQEKKEEERLREEKRREEDCHSITKTKVMCVLSFVFIAVVMLLFKFASIRAAERNVNSYVIDAVDRQSIRHFIGNVTQYQPVPAASTADSNLTEWLAEAWRRQGLDRVQEFTYNVLLSRPHPQLNSSFTIETDLGEVVYSGPTDGDPSLPPFSAYSKNATVQGDVVYCNYGRYEDYSALAALNVTVEGNIALVRLGRTAPADKQRAAQALGAIGLLLYSDPADSGGSPDAGGGRSTLRHQGDPLTPHLPALDWVSRLSLEEADLPAIPVQPIGRHDALQILHRLDGPVGPSEFQGGLEVVSEAGYRVGPGLEGNLTTTITVNNLLTMAPVTSVLGVIWGSERDRVVVVGSPHSGWIPGNGASASATAVMLELTRIFTQLEQEMDWQPRRTLVFASWCGSEDALLGSTETAQHLATSLGARAVAYLNLQRVMTGTEIFRSNSMPLLFKVLEDTARKVASPLPAPSGSAGSLFDSWLAQGAMTGVADRPQHTGLGSDTDCRTFAFQLGIPSCDFMFRGVSDPEALVGSEVMAEDMDPDMAFHEASARFWALLTVQFSDSKVLPLSVLDLAQVLLTEFLDLESEFDQLLLEMGVTLRFLEGKLREFETGAMIFEAHLDTLDQNDPWSVRATNDALMLTSRALLDQRGLPDRRTVWNQLLGPSSTNAYEMEVFPGIRDLLRRVQQSGATDDAQLKQQLVQHIDAVSYRVLSATTSLSIGLFALDDWEE